MQSCSSISKREAVRGDPSQGLLSYGPIRIEMPNRSQTSKQCPSISRVMAVSSVVSADTTVSSLLFVSDIVTMVVLPVVAVWTVGFFFIILISVAKAGSRRLTPQTDCQPPE